MLGVSHLDVTTDKNKLTELLSGAGDLMLEDACNALERIMLIRSLKDEDGNIAAAARRLGISRSRFYRLLHRHGIGQ